MRNALAVPSLLSFGKDDVELEESFQCVEHQHVQKPMFAAGGSVLSAMVATSIHPKVAAYCPKVAAARKKEKAKLDAANSFDYGSVREYKEAAADARLRKKKLHCGRIFCVDVIKHSESSEPIVKSRGVFDGSQVKTADGEQASFLECTTVPAHIEAARSVIARGNCPGWVTQQSDGTAAYLQARLRAPARGIITVVRLPRYWWPQEWIDRKMVDPVVNLLAAVYGHPESGEDWAKHCAGLLHGLGWAAVPEWPSVYRHTSGSLLALYVDDFIISAKVGLIDQLWSQIRRVVQMDDPEPLSRFLGCTYERHNVVVNGKPAVETRMNMSDFVASAVDRYLELAEKYTGVKPKLRKVNSPCRPLKSPPMTSPPESWEKFALDVEHEEVEEEGALSAGAASIIMKIMWAARIGRPDIAKATSSLARKVCKWTQSCDLDLHYLVSYLNETKGYVLTGTVGGPEEELKIVSYADADFAGSKSCRSTSGAWLELTNADESCSFPLTWNSRRQGSTARSTPEAELCAADALIHSHLIPLSDLWSTFLGRPMKSILCEDNAAALIVMKHGFSSTMRHLHRTHRICLQAIHDQIEARNIEMRACETSLMKADPFTKAFSGIENQRVLSLLRIRPG
jgi:hypothetical protein